MSNKPSRVERELSVSSTLNLLKQLELERKGKSKRNSKSAASSFGNSGDKPGGTALADSVGRTAICSHLDKDSFLEAFSRGDYATAEAYLQNNTNLPALLNSDTAALNRIKMSIRKFKESGKNIPLATAFAILCFDHGIRFEIDPGNPITTRTLLYSAQRECITDAAILLTVALKNRLKFDEKMITCTAINTLDSGRNLENYLAYGNLICQCLESNALSCDNDTSQRFLDIAFTTLTNPKKDAELVSEDDVEKRAALGYKAANLLLDKGIQLKSRFKLDYVVQDLRRIKGQNANSVRLLSRILEQDYYTLNFVSINSALAEVSHSHMELDKDLAEALYNIISCAFEKSDSLGKHGGHSELLLENIDVVTQQVMKNNPDIALRIALNAAENNYILNEETLTSILEKTANMSELKSEFDELWGIRDKEYPQV